MIGILWNCRGVSKKGMAGMLKELLSNYDVDFIGLQETMRKHYPDSFFRKIDYGNFFPGIGFPLKGNQVVFCVELI